MRDRTPEIINAQIKCKMWNICVYGAGCELSPFRSMKPKKMPLITLSENGVPICHDAQRD